MFDTQGTAIETCAQETAARQPTYLHVLRLLWKRRRFVTVATLTGIGVSLGVAFVLPREYKSSAEVMPPDPAATPGASLSQSEGTGAAAAIAASRLRSPNAMFIGILNSRTIQDDLISQFHLRGVYGVRDDASARAKLASRTTINDDRETGILSISVVDRDPVRARDLDAAYLAGLDQLIVRMSTSAARRERIFLEGRLKAVKQDLDATEHALSLYSSRSATVSPEAQERAALQSISSVQEQLIAAQAELHSLEAIYDENNVRVRAAQARIEELRSQLNDMSAPESGRANLAADAQLLPSMRKLPLLGETYSDLYLNASLEESLYEMLSKQYEAAKVEEAREIPAVRVLDPPNLPERKSSPRRMVIVICGALLSVVFAALWIVGKAIWDVMDGSDPRKLLVREIGSDLRIGRTPVLHKFTRS